MKCSYQNISKQLHLLCYSTTWCSDHATCSSRAKAFRVAIISFRISNRSKCSELLISTVGIDNGNLFPTELYEPWLATFYRMTRSSVDQILCSQQVMLVILQTVVSNVFFLQSIGRKIHRQLLFFSDYKFRVQYFLPLLWKYDYPAQSINFTFICTLSVHNLRHWGGQNFVCRWDIYLLKKWISKQCCGVHSKCY